MEKDGENVESYQLTKDGEPNGLSPKGRKRDSVKKVCTTFFRDEASLHGIRYVFLQSPWFCRRFIWFCILLTAFIIFIYLNTLNLLKYLSYPSQVSIDMSVEPSLVFPAVTICNYNKHRYTKVVDLGLFDALYSKYEPKLASQPVMRSWFTYRSDLCLDDAEEFNQVLRCESNLTQKPCNQANLPISGISSFVCEHICSSKANYELCNGFWYNRTSSKCYLSTVLMKENVTELTDLPSTCKKDSVEYYEKDFILETPSFLCTFDTDDCSKNVNFEDDIYENSFDESFVIAKASEEIDDFSAIRTKRGKYVGLFKTARRPGYKSEISSKMFLFENSCMEFFYRFLGKAETTMSVQLFTKHKTMQMLGNETGKAQSQWQRFFVKLPDGPGSIYINANRSEERVTTGLLIDNLGIKPCETYNTECVKDKQGTHYDGKISVTKSGFKCIARPDVGIPTETPFCRNPDRDTQPWCYVDNETVIWEYCDIPPCACAEDEFLCESTGKCIPKAMMCDGQADCKKYNSEDESDICESKRSVECDFTDGFLCGYTFPYTETLSWEKKSAREIYVENKPKTDPQGIQDGYFMFVDTQAEEEGSMARFISPPLNLSRQSDRCLSFQMRSYSKYSYQSKLQIFLYSGSFYSTRVLIAEYDLSEEKYEEWKKYTIRLPSTDKDVKFYMAWWYTMGLPVYSNIAIDDIRQFKSCDEEPEPNKKLLETKDSFICDFGDPENCDLFFRDKNELARWKWAPSDVHSYAFDNATACTLQFARNGTFRTPDFPDRKSLFHECLARIKGPKGSKIKLTFFNTNFTKTSNCNANFVKILTTNGTELHKFCGVNVHDGNKELLVEDDDIMLGVSSTDEVLSFHGTYELQDLPYGNALILYDEFGLSPQASSLITTSAIRFEQTHCLSVNMVTRKAKISIKGVGYNNVVVFYEYQTPTNLMKLTIPAGIYALNINTAYTGKMGTIAVITGIVVERGWCPDIHDTGDINCEFNDPDICGYLDFSASTKWHLGPDGMVLNSSDTVKKAQKANLVSPTFTTNKTACLRIRLSSEKETRLNVSAFPSFNIFDLSNAEFFEVIVAASKDQKFMIPIRSSAKRVMITVEIKEKQELTLHSVNLMACTDTSYVLKLQGQVTPGMEESMDESSKLLSDTLPTQTSSGAEVIEPESSYSPPKPDTEKGFHSRRNYTAYFNVGDLNEVTAHQLEDMVFSCTFNEEKCDLKKDFIKQRTSYGVCYTFNSGKNNTVKQTTIPGSKYGLRLVLNIETYQNMKGLKTDDGIKIHVHDQDDIPYVQYVGKAAAVSHHTYFEISQQDIHSMKAPHGKCDERELSLYPNETYTRFRCNQECEALAWQRHCGCIDYYMPGNWEYCTFPEWEDCRNSVDVNETFSCYCPTACESYSYPSQSSSSSLAYMGVSKYLFEEEKIERIKKHREYSLNKDYRMVPKNFLNIRQQLKDVSKMLEELRDFISEQSIEQETSKFSLIQRALQEFFDHSMSDIGRLKPLLVKLNEGAECLRRMSNMIREDIKTALNDLTYLLNLFSKSPMPLPESTLKNILLARSQRVADFFVGFSESFPRSCYRRGMPGVDIWLPGMWGFFPNYNPDDFIKKLSSFSEDESLKTQIFHDVNIIIPQETDSYKEYTTNMTIKDTLVRLYEYVKANTSFSEEVGFFYINALENVTKVVLDAIEIGHEEMTNPDYDTERTLLKEMDKLRDAFQSNYAEPFFGNLVTISEIARGLTYTHFEIMGNVMKRSKAVIQKTMLDGLNSEIYQHGPMSTYSMYMKALSGVANIYKFMSNTVQKNVTETVRNMTIWLEPSANIDSDDYVVYDLDEESLSRIWPTSMEFSDFLKYDARKILQRNIDRFYGRLGEVLYTLEKDIENQIDAFEDSYKALNDTLKGILEELEVNEAFLLENFLKVDVFYGELIHNIIQVSDAYSLTDFFNGIGGYFGLLLGASCITLIEFLDLIVYNLYMQAGKLRKGKKQSVNGGEKASSV